MSPFGGNALLIGLATGVTYLLSIGPNNLMIIREALSRGRVFIVASVILMSYVVLLLVALMFNEAVVAHVVAMRTMLGWLGLVAIFCFSFLSFRSAFRSVSDIGGAGARQETMAACLKRSMEVAWLNPLMYVEFLIIPAAFSNNFNSLALRQYFILGLIIMSAVCCYGYAIGGGVCAVLFRHHRTLQVFDLISGSLLAVLGLAMGASLMTGLA